MIKYLGTWASTNKHHAANDSVPALTMILLILSAIGLFILAIQKIDIANQEVQSEIHAGTFRVGPYWGQEVGR